MLNTFTEVQTQFERHALRLEHALEVKPLSGVQEYAIDLYERGFNVFPIPTAYDWNLRGAQKKPYKAEPLYRNRMHFVKGCACSTCQRYNFVTLFEDSNIAIMCGANSGNLLSVDCDSQESFKYMGDELTRRGLVFWAFTSHRGGAYLLRVIEGEAENITQEKSFYEDVQIWGSRHFVVVPPSIHNRGTPYKWLSPEPLTMLPRDTLQAVSIDALGWLGVTLKKFSKSEDEEDIDGLAEYAKNLSHASRHTLKHGAKQGGRNSALTALVCDLVGIGLDEDEVESAMQTAADNCTPPYNDRDHKIQPLIEWAFSKERKPSRSYQSKVNRTIQDWQRAQAFAKSFDWRAEFGGQALYARRVFTACTKRARMDPRGKVFRAAGREVATLANMPLKTVQRYLHLLESHELLIHKGKEASGANFFSFSSTFICSQYYNIDSILTTNERTEKNAFLFDGEDTDAEKDAFKGLGMYAFSIWCDLVVTPAKNSYQLAKRLNLSEKTVRATLARLVLAGLVSHSHSEGAYFGNALTEAQLSVKAADRGTAGMAKGKRAQYVKDRERYVNRVIAKSKSWHKRESARLESETPVPRMARR